MGWKVYDKYGGEKQGSFSTAGVYESGVLKGNRDRLNFVDDAITVTDNAGQNRIDITINPWTDSGWQRLGIEIAYEGGHTNYGAPFGGSGWVGIRRLPSGIVVGKGLIQGGSGAVFTLPVGFRPASTPEEWIIMTANSSASNEAFRMATVGGNAWKMMNSLGWGWASLAGICWYAEQ